MLRTNARESTTLILSCFHLAFSSLVACSLPKPVLPTISMIDRSLWAAT